MGVSWFTATVVTEDGEIPLRDLPVGEVVSAALTAGPDDGWQYISFLHLRGDRETFDAARALCRSDEPNRRALGADILAQLGALTVTSAEKTASVPVEERPFRAPSARSPGTAHTPTSRCGGWWCSPSPASPTTTTPRRPT